MKCLGGQICFTIIPDSLIDSIEETIDHIHCENTSRRLFDQSIFFCHSVWRTAKAAIYFESPLKSLVPYTFGVSNKVVIYGLPQLGSVAGPVIHANGRLTFEDDLRSGGLLYFTTQ